MDLRPADFVPDFAVMVAGGLEEPGAGMGGIDDFDIGQDAREFGEDVAIQVERGAGLRARGRR